MFFAVITGHIYDAGYFRSLLISGTGLVIVSHMLLSICKSYQQIMLFQGVCIALDSGALFVPGVANLPSYFTTRISLAAGIAASGSSLGSVIYPIIFHNLQPRLGFGWTVRVIVLTALLGLLLPILSMRVRKLSSTHRNIIDYTGLSGTALYILHPGILPCIHGALRTAILCTTSCYRRRHHRLKSRFLSTADSKCRFCFWTHHSASPGRHVWPIEYNDDMRYSFGYFGLLSCGDYKNSVTDCFLLFMWLLLWCFCFFNATNPHFAVTKTWRNWNQDEGVLYYSCWGHTQFAWFQYCLDLWRCFYSSRQRLCYRGKNVSSRLDSSSKIVNNQPVT